MDYEQKYKEALERAKCEWVKNLDNAYKNYRERLEIIFPELKESEDERIRKSIICGMNALKEQGKETFATIPIDDAIAWLEKQGEQKPTDKVEPKFKVGDILKHNKSNVIVEVLSANVGFYCLRNILGKGDEMELYNVEKNFHLWTIQDAKDGDVLVGNKGEVILMFRGIGNTEWDDVIDYHCYYDCCHENFVVQKSAEYWGNTENNQLKPATKEQCELLFKKMKEAGYEWDAEKKELNKVGKKLTELAKGEDYGIDGLYAAVDILQKTLGEVDGYQTDDGILEHECAISAVKKLYEQNPTWSEEDDYNLQCMIAKVTSDIQKGNVGRNNELIDWLKSLKERVQPQPKQEWSDEDEFRLNRTVENIELLNDANGNILFKDIEWLKSIKDRLSKVKNC